LLNFNNISYRPIIIERLSYGHRSCAAHYGCAYQKYPISHFDKRYVRNRTFSTASTLLTFRVRIRNFNERNLGNLLLKLFVFRKLLLFGNHPTNKEAQENEKEKQSNNSSCDNKPPVVNRFLLVSYRRRHSCYICFSLSGTRIFIHLSYNLLLDFIVLMDCDCMD
jgi:hypothetical protein